MMKLSSRAVIVAFASLMLVGTASAQAPAATPATPAAKSAPADTKATAKTAKPRTEISLECSKQADAKGLHGKERHKFRADCKKTGGKAG